MDFAPEEETGALFIEAKNISEVLGSLRMAEDVFRGHAGASGKCPFL
jgi:hypothetical protein